MILCKTVDKYVKPLISKALGTSAARKNTPMRVTAVMAACMILIFMASAVPAQPRETLFLGLMNEKGEPVQSEMEQALRNAFAANSRIKLTGTLETQRIVREKERLGRSNVENFIPPSVKLDSSTIIIKGVVYEPVFDLKRHLLLWGKIDARIDVKVYFEEISGKATYQGDFSAKAMRKKDFLLFASARKNVHISAADRSELLGEMQSQIVKEVSALAETFFNALTGDAEDNPADTGNIADTLDTNTAGQENEPSEPEAADTSGVERSDTSAAESK